MRVHAKLTKLINAVLTVKMGESLLFIQRKYWLETFIWANAVKKSLLTALVITTNQKLHLNNCCFGLEEFIHYVSCQIWSPPLSFICVPSLISRSKAYTEIDIINRPGVAGAVLQSLPSLIHSLRDTFVQNLHDTVYPKQ